ncbi:MAG: hypothetical protein E7231_04435 [Cellulosilyticum sp.]|nr:hypothetical protein [Cellulosilyticum sp.]
MKKKIAFILAGLLIFVPVNASTLTDKKNELNSTKQNIKEKQEAVNEKKAQKEAIQEEIKEVDLQLVAIQDNIKELTTQINEKQEQIVVSTEKLEEANIKKDDQYEATKERMVQMYKNQKIGYMQVIFSSDNFWEAMNRVEYVRRISQKDNNILDEYQAQIETIEEQKQIIEQEKTELDSLKADEVAKNKELETTRSKKSDAMAQLAAEEGKLQSEIESLSTISEELTSEIQALVKKLEEEEARKQQQAQSSSSSGNNNSTQYVGGTFMWPVPGYYRISSDYVDRTSPIFGTAEFHTGIDIPASYGEDVVAAADGVVITSGWIRGYGNTVMISHGGGIVTLYGHNSSLVISNGATVKKGQVIAKIGSTGYSTGNHCHFEVRRNGSHTSPWPYLNS